MKRWNVLLMLVIVLLAGGFVALKPIAAQDEAQVCQGIIAKALEETALYCNGAGRNQACYGNLEVEAAPQPDITDLVFFQRGDIEDIDRISSMSLSELNNDAGTWGVVRMEVQADIDDALLASNVTMLMFGRVSVQNQGMKDVSELARPLQAFVIQTGKDDAPCAAAPQSGMLIQTPEGIAEINLLINEVHISLGSTAYIQAQPGGSMSVSLLEGHAHLTTRDGEVTLVPGTETVIALDADGIASAAPSEPQPYDTSVLGALPLQTLPRLFAPPVAVADASAVAAPLGMLATVQGPIDSVNGNMITIYGLPIRTDLANPLATALRVGDVVRVEGERVIEGGNLIILARSITFIDIDVLISASGELWRDPGDCTSVPPDWAFAPHWTTRCVAAAPPQNSGNQGGGGGGSPASPPQNNGGSGNSGPGNQGGGHDDDDHGHHHHHDDDDDD